MLVGVISVKLFIPASHSLKDKRRVVKSLITRLQNKFNVSAAEVGELEQWQVAEIGVALISNETKILHQQISRIISFIEVGNEYEIINISSEIM